MDAAVEALCGDEARVAQHTQVAADVGLRYPQRAGEVADRPLAITEFIDDEQALQVGQCPADARAIR